VATFDKTDHRDILIPSRISESNFVLTDVLCVYPSILNSKMNLLKPGRGVDGLIASLIFFDYDASLTVYIARGRRSRIPRAKEICFGPQCFTKSLFRPQKSLEGDVGK